MVSVTWQAYDGDVTTTSVNLTHHPVTGPMRSPTIDFSSLANLADCQWRWYARHVRLFEDKPGTAAMLGTLMGRLCAAWYRGDHWEEILRDEVLVWQIENPDLASEIGQPEYMERAFWLMTRYVEHYADDRPQVKVLGTEVYFKLRLPGRYGWLCGAIDELWLIDGRCWVVERKTMGDWSKMDQHERSHQTTFYLWAAQQLGYDPWGIMLDCIRTYRWKRDEHPPADSFDRRWFDRGPVHLSNALLEAGKGLTLAKALIGGHMKPLRNIADHCSWCPYTAECFTELGFDDATPDVFEMED